MNRIEIIQSLIDKNNYKSYLEVGVQAGHCFTAIKCDRKTGVDPDAASAATIHQPSDQFFLENSSNFDIIFLDGLHHDDQLYKDIINSLAVLNQDGIIVLHDMLPTSKHMQEIPLTDQDEWTGNVWRAFLKLRTEREDLEMCVVNCDWGCGIIKKGKQKILQLASTTPNSEITYEDFVKNKHQWMNIISVDQFKEKYL